jgi:hypothetical protein
MMEKIEKWQKAWEMSDDEGNWSVKLIKKYWAASYAVFNGVGNNLAMLFSDASDMLSTYEPADMSFETGLERLAETCEKLIKNTPSDIEMAAGIHKWTTTAEARLDAVWKYLCHLEDSGKISGLIFLARNLYSDPENAGHGIGQVVKWYKDRVMFILEKVEELEREMVEEAKIKVEKDKTSIRKAIIPFSTKMLPRLSMRGRYAAINSSGTGWTDGNMADLIRIPDTVKLTDGAKVDFKVLVDRFRYDDVTSNYIEITPVAIDKTIDKNPLVLFVDDRDGVYAAKAVYVKYFLREYKKVQMRIAADAMARPDQPILVYQDSRPVGLVARRMRILSDVEREVLSEIKSLSETLAAAS